MLIPNTRRNILIYLFTLLIILFPTETILAQGVIVYETVYSNSLEGNFLEDSPIRDIAIYLPPDYDTNNQKFYPVIYLLHGYTHNHRTWLKNGSLQMDIKVILNDLIDQKIIQPVIVVMPNGYNKYQGCWYANSSITGDWEDFIVIDLVAHIENNYRAIVQKESRGIAGHSMGGTGAFKIAMNHPEVFCSVFSLSAGFISFEHSLMGPNYKPYLINAVSQTNPTKFNSLYWRERVAIAAAASFAPNKDRLPYYGDFPVDALGALIDSNWVKWLKHDAYTMIDTNKNNLLQLNAIWIDCGTADDLYLSNHKVSEKLDSAGIEHTWDTYSGGHVDKIGQRIKEKMLPFFSDNLITSILQDDLPSINTFDLYQNYPNPFNPLTKITFILPKTEIVKLQVYNTLGQIVGNLVEDKLQTGSYEYEFNARHLPSGVYFYRLQAGDYVDVKKMFFLK